MQKSQKRDVREEWTEQPHLEIVEQHWREAEKAECRNGAVVVVNREKPDIPVFLLQQSVIVS